MPFPLKPICLASALALGAALAGASAFAAPAPDALSFTVKEGLNLNAFYRKGPVAAHTVLRSGTDPRILVAFPAGNSGVAVWFEPLAKPAEWTLSAQPRAVTQADAKGRPLYGVISDIAIAAPQLKVKQAVLSSVRVLRDYQGLGTAPAPVLTAADPSGDTLTWSRDRLDGAAGYRLSLQVTDGTVSDDVILAGRDGRIGLRVTALSGETPLTPMAPGGLLNARATNDTPARNALTFLSYQEKFEAGSWRFNTYFGRDTLMSLRLLMPALQPPAVEAGLKSVLARLSPDGEVAHEEDIGEFAVLDHQKADHTTSDAPVFDYKMIDSSYLLGPVAGAWLLDDARGRGRAKAFLASQDGRYGHPDTKAGQDLVGNLKRVIASARAFAQDPKAANLIHIKDGYDVGEWRDSNDGLGKGRYPYDVNAVFVPKALETASRLYESGLLDPYLSAADRPLFADAGHAAAVWRQKAPAFFDVQVDNARARHAVSAYAQSVGVSDAAALQSLGRDAVDFHALSLNTDGTPVTIEHSDDGFALLFDQPAPQDLDRMVRAMMRPFPAGLMTPVGMVVANPVFATPESQARFGKNAYHGTVVWSWQQAVMAEGLERQLARKDLPANVRADLGRAQKTLWQAIDNARAVRSSELWSWSYANGQYAVAPFGASGADADEANAAQLWSTVYLAIPEPKSSRRKH